MKFGEIEITKLATLAALAKGDIHNAIIAETPGGAEAQEAAGQKKFVANQTLPKDCPRRELESLGFVFGDDADDLFISVQFPKGWSKQATNRSMWSDLLDEKGRKRAAIFYKATFYDQKARLILLNRYRPTHTYSIDKKPYVAQIQDVGVVIWESEPVDTHDKGGYEISEQLNAIVKTEIEKRFPDWQNPLAYWD